MNVREVQIVIEERLSFKIDHDHVLPHLFQTTIRVDITCSVDKVSLNKQGVTDNNNNRYTVLEISDIYSGLICRYLYIRSLITTKFSVRY